MQVTIGGVALDGVTTLLQHGSMQITRAIGQRSTGQFVVVDTTGTARYYQGQPVVITDNLNNTAFAGVVTSDQRIRATQGATIEHTVQVSDNHYYADAKLAPYAATNKTCGQIVNDLINNFLAPEGVTAGQIDSGPVVVSLTSNYATCADVLDALVSKAGGGWYWVITDAKTLHFRQQTTAPAAPFTVDDDLIERGTDVATHSGDQYRNTQYMLGGVTQTLQQTETRQGDGKTIAFTMGYELNATPTITLNGGAQTVGILGVDTGKQWYWNLGSQIITQDGGGTKLVSTDTLQVVYIGQFQSVAISNDNAAITTMQMRAGGATSGIVEAVAFDTTTTSSDQAFQSAAGYLSTYAQDLDTLQGMTTSYGFIEGQLATVNVPAHDFINTPMLVEQVVITDSGPLSAELVDLYYTLKCVSGPTNTGWQAFFKNLAGQAQQIIGAITLGQSSTLTVLESVNESWGWSESVSETVNVCSFPGATLYPGATLFPC
jgi:hypothetical protein